VLEALDKIKDLPLEIICPGHGPVLRDKLYYYTGLYREWSTPAVPGEDALPKIVMAYVTAYGYTKMIADGVAEGLSMVGDFNLETFNLSDTALEEVLEEIKTADGLLIGSPTLVGRHTTAGMELADPSFSHHSW
jgi:flavorubredoxin